MTQVNTVTKNEHANGTFDVIYRNPKSGDANGTESAYLWTHLITAVIAGVSGMLAQNSYRDQTDKDKATAFIEGLAENFKLLFVKLETGEGVAYQNRTMGEIGADVALLSEEEQMLLSKVLDTIHVSGSIVSKEDPAQMSGLVTITYFLPGQENFAKVRLSGRQIEAVGLALRAPYVKALENGTLEVSAAKIDTERAAPAAPAKKPNLGELRLPKDQLDYLANAISANLLAQLNKGNQQRPQGGQKRPQGGKPNHAGNKPAQAQARQ